MLFTLCYVASSTESLVWVIYDELTKVTVVLLEKVNTILFLIKERPYRKCGKLVHPPPYYCTGKEPEPLVL